jgi:hypothetical protein
MSVINSRFYLLLILTFFAFNCDAKSEHDYLYYHECIRGIENDFFGKGDTSKSILTRYLNLFEDYDFVYLQDCYTAMQLAIFLHGERYFMKFMAKATKNGLNKSNLSHFKYILESNFYKGNKDSIGKLITENRPQYLSRINRDLLVEVTRLYALDQAQKNCLPKESMAKCNSRYREAYKITREKLLELIKEYGIPSDRQIGVDQDDLLTELGVYRKSLMHYYDLYKDYYNITGSQYRLDDRVVASTLLIPLMWHGNCSWLALKPFLKDQLKKGNIHPRDIAIIKDEDFRSVNICELTKDSLYFNIGNEQLLKLSRRTVNSNRARNFISSMESDSVKLVYEHRYHMILRYGFVGKR